MTDTPFVAIGNEQLGSQLPPFIVCPHCHQEHEITCSSSEPSNQGNRITLQFYKCEGKTYLAGINHHGLGRYSVLRLSS